MTDALIVVTTTPSRDLAERIAYLLVERRQAACVQITGPAESTYRWLDAMEIAREEWICTAKTVVARYEALEQSIREAHTYENPEIIALPIYCGSAKYLDWLRANTTEAAPTDGQAESSAANPN